MKTTRPRRAPDRQDRPDDPAWEWRQTYWYDVGYQVRGGRTVTHLRVQRLDGKDGIGWDVLQRIKNDVVGQDVVMVELYPPQDGVVNEVNMRHLWEVPPEWVDFGLRR